MLSILQAAGRHFHAAGVSRLPRLDLRAAQVRNAHACLRALISLPALVHCVSAFVVDARLYRVVKPLVSSAAAAAPLSAFPTDAYLRALIGFTLFR